MSEADDLFAQLKALFGDPGGTVYPGNVGAAQTAVPVCLKLMQEGHPGLRAYFDAWESRYEHPDPRLPWGIEQLLVRGGMAEAAWMLARLEDDVCAREQARTGKPLDRGHTLCNLALVGQAMGSATLQRHYALLSSAGDIHQSASDGLGPALALAAESRRSHYDWRLQVGQWLADPSRPQGAVYLEALLACRWFVTKRAKHVLRAAGVREGGGRPFVERLLELATKGEAKTTAAEQRRGTLFEAAGGLLLSATPGFAVYEGRRTSDEQVDLAVHYAPEPLAPVGLEPGPGLVECKSSDEPVDSAELRNFGAKCAFHGVRFGVLIARQGITGKHRTRTAAELVRRRFRNDGVLLLVITAKDMEGRWYEMRGLAEPLAEDLRELVFGPKG